MATLTAMQSNEWVEAFSKQVGRGIDQARGDRSDQWIAERTKELDHPLSRTAVSEYRRGVRKSMPVTDLIILAAALEVPPVAILFPDLATAPTEVLPGEALPSIEAVQWFTGEQGKPLQEKDTVFSKVPVTKFHTENSREFKLLRASRKLAEEIRKASTLLRYVRNVLELAEGGPDLEELRRQFDTTLAEQRLEEWAEEVRALGGDADVSPSEVSHRGDH